MKRIAFVYLGAGTFHGQPIGLLCLAAWIRKYCPEWTPSIVDGNLVNVFDHFIDNTYDVVAISSMAQQFEKAKRLGKRIKGPTKVIIGGVHVTTMPEAFDKSCFDAAFLGEGEETLAWYLNNGTPDGVYEAGDPIDLVDYPDLDYSLLSPEYFKPKPIRIWQDVVVQAMMITSRGCPYSCRFCSTTNFWKRYRAHSPEWVIRQMLRLHALGVTHVQIFDDLFTVNVKWLSEVATRFARAGRPIRNVTVLSRADVFDRRIALLLKRINCSSVTFGFESGSNRVLKYLKDERCSLDHNKRAIEVAVQNGLRVCGSFMVGSPTETESDILKTIRFMLWGLVHGLTDAWPFVSTPYPGTEFWDIARAKGKVSNDMNFNELRMCSKFIGPSLMIDIPRWRFAIMWTLVQVSLAPFKIRKALRIVASILRKTARGVLWI